MTRASPPITPPTIDLTFEAECGVETGRLLLFAKPIEGVPVRGTLKMLRRC